MPSCSNRAYPAAPPSGDSATVVAAARDNVALSRLILAQADSNACKRSATAQNEALLRRYREFRRGADAVTTAWRGYPEVIAVSLIGSVARAPWKEVPRFGPYRRAWVALWHECKDVDLALWLDHLDSLDALRRARARALRSLWDEASIGIASHQVDVFILEPGTDRYLGRLCDFNACPKGKAECRVPGCGDVALLRQHEGFRWRPESLAEGRAVRLFERATGLQRSASDLPLLEVDAG